MLGSHRALPEADKPARGYEVPVATQFALFGGAVVLTTTLIVGWLGTALATRDVIGSAAPATALFVDSIVAPLVQELDDRTALSAASIAQLNAVFQGPALRERFPFLEVWKADGTIVYSNVQDLIGRRYPPPESLTEAFQGQIVSAMADLRAAEHRVRSFDEEFLEIYTPIRDLGGGEILAVAEIHETSTALREQLDAAAQRSWSLVAGIAALVMISLLALVMRGNGIIRRQQSRLVDRIGETERALAEVRRLKNAVQSATSRLVERDEMAYRRIGADLHDALASTDAHPKIHCRELFSEHQNLFGEIWVCYAIHRGDGNIARLQLSKIRHFAPDQVDLIKDGCEVFRRKPPSLGQLDTIRASIK